MPKGSHPNSKANLLKGVRFTAETASEKGRKGALASNKSQAEAKTIKQVIQMALNTKITNSQGKEVTVKEAVVMAQVKKALAGDSKAFNNLGEYSGEKPAEKQEVEFKQPRQFVFVVKK